MNTPEHSGYEWIPHPNSCGPECYSLRAHALVDTRFQFSLVPYPARIEQREDRKWDMFAWKEGKGSRLGDFKLVGEAPSAQEAADALFTMSLFGALR